jgi:hypothetical protein
VFMCDIINKNIKTFEMNLLKSQCKNSQVRV